ncbi:MAG: hypothetical protein IID40_06505 [Planctomycetes bacterium]|nr:hypothetical protein [Planctomycetota bacterium]
MSDLPPPSPGRPQTGIPSAPSAPAVAQPGDTQPSYVPLSGVSVAGFVCSVLVCIPILAQLLGLILGIVGLSQTSGGRRRGRGWAIAAVIISPLVALGLCAVGCVGFVFFKAVVTLPQNVQLVLAASDDDLAAAARALHDNHFSERLKLQVDDQALVAFARRVEAAYGHLTGIRRADEVLKQTADGQSHLIHVIGQFDDEEIDIKITTGFKGLTAQIDDIVVGDFALMPRQ